MTEKLLMILTSHRLDCLSLALDLLVDTGNLSEFDRAVFLLNGVEGRHRRYVEDFMGAHPEVAWDTVSGPRGRAERISSLENECIRRYPGRLYVKMDEDMFVAPGWARRLFEAHAAHAEDENLALVTPLIPNNAWGLYQLLTCYYPEWKDEYDRRFNADLTPTIDGPAWQRPDIAEWATRKFINIREANERHRARLEERKLPRYVRFSERFSIGSICFDYRHWEKMGGIPPKDEMEWCAWIQEHRQFNVLDATQIALHYSFFVQQDWLDRTSLLEDIRHVNLPNTLPRAAGWRYWGPRWARIAAQLPRASRRWLAARLNAFRR